MSVDNTARRYSAVDDGGRVDLQAGTAWYLASGESARRPRLLAVAGFIHHH